MEYVNNITLEDKELSKKLQNEFSLSDFTADKLVKGCKYDDDFSTISDAVGRIQSIERTADEFQVSKLRRLLHSQEAKKNFGAFKMLGFEEVPQVLMDLSVILSHTFRTPYKANAVHSFVAPMTTDAVEEVTEVTNLKLHSEQSSEDLSEQPSKQLLGDTEAKLLMEAGTFFSKNPHKLLELILELPRDIKKSLLTDMLFDLL